MRRVFDENFRPTGLVDVCFIIDATISMKNMFASVIDNVNDFVINLKINYRKINFLYGAVVYRDPIDYRPFPPSSPIEPEYREQLDLIEKTDKQKRDQILIENGLDVEEYEKSIKEITEAYDRETYPFDKNVPIQFSNEIDDLFNELSKVECGGGNDDAEDLVGGLNCALNDLEWRKNSRKLIVWISDSNAHGKKFCGFDNHNEEECKLEKLIQQIAEKRITFFGINITSECDKEGCKLTLNEMKKIYLQFNGPAFIIGEFKYKEQIIDAWPDDEKNWLSVLNRVRNY